MKRSTVVLLCLLVAAVSVLAQSNEDHEQSLKKKSVPKAILDAFAKSYPHATVKGYSKEVENGTTEYEIGSKEGKISRDVSYSEDGTVLAVEESMPYADLPDPVRATITKEYPKHTAATCEKVTKGTMTQFEVLLKKGKKKTEVVFDASGAVVKQESKDKE